VRGGERSFDGLRSACDHGCAQVLTSFCAALSYSPSLPRGGGAAGGPREPPQLGPGIRIASLPELGPGGSWSTCLMGCNAPEPRDVAHLQFRSRIAFKLVWAPPSFDACVRARRPTAHLPPHRRRRPRRRMWLLSRSATRFGAPNLDTDTVDGGGGGCSS